MSARPARDARNPESPLEVLQFAHPWLAAGVVAAALPVLLHLLLRPRPRRIAFPAIRWVRSELASGRRSQRLRHVALLALRALAIGAAALLLAGPTCRSPGTTPASGPTSCVVVLDQSPSVEYEASDGRTIAARLRDAAEAFARQAVEWPQPSELGLVWSGSGDRDLPLSADIGRVRAELRRGAARAADWRPLGAALRRAVEMVRTAPRQRRRIVVFTDGLVHAWRDVTSLASTDAAGVELDVVRDATEVRTNLAILDVQAPPIVASANSPISLRIEARADGVPAQVHVIADGVAGRLAASGTERLESGQTRSIPLLLPPMPAGVHPVRVSLRPIDRLAFDQVRFAAIETIDVPDVWLIDGERGATPGLAGIILANLLAPETLPQSQQRVRLLRWSAEDDRAAIRGHVAATALDATVSGPSLIVMLSDASPDEELRRRVTAAVERGATLLLAAGDLSSDTDWPAFRAWIAASPPVCERLDGPQAIRWRAEASLLRRFDGVREMERCALRARLAFTSLVSNSVPDATFADGIPAVISAPRGRGRVLLLAAGVTPADGELGIRAAGLLSLLHGLAASGGDGADVREQLLGEPSVGASPRAPDGARLVLGADSADVTRRVGAAAVADDAAAAAGVFELFGGASSAWLVRNGTPLESSPELLDEASLREIVGLELVRLAGVDDVARLARADAADEAMALSPSQGIAVLLLAMLACEAMLAARRAPARAA